ncbi:MAG: hypothetical protein ACYDH9_10045 [Limisphaerales bacterium]
MNDALKRVDFLMELPESGRLSQDKRETVVALAEQLLPQELFADLRVKGRSKRHSDIPAPSAQSFYKCPCMHCLNNIKFLERQGVLRFA